MAHQKSYKKFVATAATATIVATALVPAAFADEVKTAAFTDVAPQYQAAIDFVVEQTIAKGITETQFGISKEIIRGDAAVMIANAAGLNDPDAPASGFTDVPARAALAINSLKAAGVTNGVSATSFDFSGDISRGEAAIFLANAFNLQGDTSNVKFTDVNSRYMAAVAALVDNGVTNGKSSTQFGTDDNITRGDFARWIFALEERIVKETPEVASVMAINNTSVELVGEGLVNLTAANVSVEGNKVKSVEVDEVTGNAVVTFETPFVSGVEQTLVFTDAEDVETSFTFTYNLEVATVEASTTRVDDSTAEQFLGFTINGKDSVSVDYLLAAGYTVDFQATNEAVFANEVTGELDETELSSDFAYKVVISKGNVIVESALVEVEVLDFDTYVSGLSALTVDQGNVSVESGKVSVQNGTVIVTSPKATVLSGATVIDHTVTYKSSNPAVATVNAITGEVTPIKAGSVTITASADEATSSVNLSVVSGARQAATVTATTSSVKLLAGKDQTVDFTAVDQYGDEFEGALTLVSRDTDVATGNVATFVDGKATGSVSAEAAGNTTIDLMRGTTVLKSIVMSVSDDAVVATRKLETVSPSADLKLDVVQGSEDANVELVWNTYNKGGFLIGAEEALASTYSVSSSNTEVATIDVKLDELTSLPTGKIVVNALTAGTTQVVIKEGTVTRATATITVVDSTPTISNVEFESVADVTTAAALTNAQVLKSEGITLSSTEFTAEIAADGTIFADVDGTVGYDSAEDITLGLLTAEYSGDAADIESLDILAGSVTGTVAPGAEGTIVAFVTLEGEDVAFATTTINVKTPAAE